MFNFLSNYKKNALIRKFYKSVRDNMDVREFNKIESAYHKVEEDFSRKIYPYMSDRICEFECLKLTENYAYLWTHTIQGSFMMVFDKKELVEGDTTKELKAKKPLLEYVDQTSIGCGMGINDISMRSQEDFDKIINEFNIYIANRSEK